MKILNPAVVVMLLVFSGCIAAGFTPTSTHQNVSEYRASPDYDKLESTHTVFVEVATAEFCSFCAGWSDNLYAAYESGLYDFEYVEMIIWGAGWNDILNMDAFNWKDIYGISPYTTGIPVSIMDGDYRRITGNVPSLIESRLTACGERTVADISAEVMLDWMGDAQVWVNISIENNEPTQYEGHIRACLMEINSRYAHPGDDPFLYGFLAYIYNEDVVIPAGDVYTDSVLWNGHDHSDYHGDDFGDITADNIKVVMGVLNNADGYGDETVAATVNQPPYTPYNPVPSDNAQQVNHSTTLLWSGGDPDPDDTVTYDVYFGNTTPPPYVTSTAAESYQITQLEENTTYYWKIMAEDNHGKTTYGPEWSFTTKTHCGDVNKDGVINVSDAVCIINYVFIQGFPAPDPVCRADVNGDGSVNVSDAVALINFIFTPGSPPPVETCCL